MEADLILQPPAVTLLLLQLLPQFHRLSFGHGYLLLSFLVFFFVSLQKVLPLFDGVIPLPDVLVGLGKFLEGGKQDCNTFDAAGCVTFYRSGLNTVCSDVSARIRSATVSFY